MLHVDHDLGSLKAHEVLAQDHGLPATDHDSLGAELEVQRRLAAVLAAQAEPGRRPFPDLLVRSAAENEVERRRRERARGGELGGR